MSPTFVLRLPGRVNKTFEKTFPYIVSPAQDLPIGCNDDLHTTYRPAYRPQFMISPSQKIHCDHRRGFRKPISLDHRNSGRVKHPGKPRLKSRPTGNDHLDISSQCIPPFRSDEHTSELQSLMRISYAVFCLNK